MAPEAGLQIRADLQAITEIRATGQRKRYCPTPARIDNFGAGKAWKVIVGFSLVRQAPLVSTARKIKVETPGLAMVKHWPCVCRVPGQDNGCSPSVAFFTPQKQGPVVLPIGTSYIGAKSPRLAATMQLKTQ